MGNPSQCKVAFYIDRELDARMRAAMLHTMAVEGHRSLSEFLSRAVLYETVRLEARHNDGDQFTRMSEVRIPRGRPLEHHSRDDGR
jgi:hypothetical protein